MQTEEAGKQEVKVRLFSVKQVVKRIDLWFSREMSVDIYICRFVLAINKVCNRKVFDPSHCKKLPEPAAVFWLGTG